MEASSEWPCAAGEKTADEPTNSDKMNTLGHYFRLTTFGESHGAAVGGVIDGMPPGVKVDVDYIQRELNRRRPG